MDEPERLLQGDITALPSVVRFLLQPSLPQPLTQYLPPVERPYDPRPYDSRYSRDFDDRRRGGGRYDEYRGGRDYDRYRDYDRDRGYGRDRYDDRRH